jgi:hypothetical protein
MTLASLVLLPQGRVMRESCTHHFGLEKAMILNSAPFPRACHRSEAFYASHLHLFNMQIKFFESFFQGHHRHDAQVSS